MEFALVAPPGLKTSRVELPVFLETCNYTCVRLSCTQRCVSPLSPADHGCCGTRQNAAPPALSSRGIHHIECSASAPHLRCSAPPLLRHPAASMRAQAHKRIANAPYLSVRSKRIFLRTVRDAPFAPLFDRQLPRQNGANKRGQVWELGHHVGDRDAHTFAPHDGRP